MCYYVFCSLTFCDQFSISHIDAFIQARVPTRAALTNGLSTTTTPLIAAVIRLVGRTQTNAVTTERAMTRTMISLQEVGSLILKKVSCTFVPQ